MKRTLVLLLALVLVAGLTAGCEKKFTEKRFDTMIVKGQSRMEVEKILGKPQAKRETSWKWVDFDEGYSGKVLFDRSGKVTGKKFTNSQTMRDDPDPETQWTEEDDAKAGTRSEKTEMMVSE